MENVALTDYREILLQEFDARSQRNSSYSMRAFARDLKISPSRLNDVIKGRYGLSLHASRSISSRLGLSKEDQKRFCDAVEAKHARSRHKRQLAQARLLRYVDTSYLQIREDQFRVISDWYHLAILELCMLEDFKSDPDWIAGALRIQKSVVERAIERLKRLGLLTETDSHLAPTNEFSSISSDTPSAAIREFHLQILQKAAGALVNQDVADREFGTVFVAIDKKEIGEAKEAIRKFKREFISERSRAIKKDSVYCLSLQFFELVNNRSESKE